MRVLDQDVRRTSAPARSDRFVNGAATQQGRRRIIRGAAALVVVAGMAVGAQGQTASAVRTLVEEVFVRLAGTGGRAAVVQIERAGGREAVEAVLVQAEREGGATLARRAASILSEAGAPGMSVLARSPIKAAAALDGLSGPALRAGVEALERSPSILSLPSTVARGAIAAESRLPGVGATIVETLGDDGARIAANLTESEGVSLARWSSDVAALPVRERSAVVAAIEKRPGAVLDYLDRHPGVLVAGTITAGAAVVEMTALVAGREGPTSAAVRGAVKIADEALSTPLAITVTIAGIVLVGMGAAWLLPSVLRRWRRAGRVV